MLQLLQQHRHGSLRASTLRSTACLPALDRQRARRVRARPGRRHSCSIALPTIWPSGCRRAAQFERGRSRHADRRVAPRARGAVCAHRRRSVAASRSIEASAVVADEEALPFRDGSLDLVVSALALQFVNDLPGTLVQIRRALKPDGLFLAAHARRRHPDRVARSLRRGRKRDRGRRLAARGAIRRSARSRRAAAARRLRAAGHRQRARHGALRLGVRADARPAPHGRHQCADRAPPHAAPARDVAAHGGNLRRAFCRSPTAACARRSRSSGCRAGRRTRASSSRSSRARRRRGSPMRCAPEISAGEKAGASVRRTVRDA